MIIISGNELKKIENLQNDFDLEVKIKKHELTDTGLVIDPQDAKWIVDGIYFILGAITIGALRGVGKDLWDKIKEMLLGPFQPNKKSNPNQNSCDFGLSFKYGNHQIFLMFKPSIKEEEIEKYSNSTLENFLNSVPIELDTAVDIINANKKHIKGRQILFKDSSGNWSFHKNEKGIEIDQFFTKDA